MNKRPPFPRIRLGLHVLVLLTLSLTSLQSLAAQLDVVVSIKPVHALITALMDGAESPRLLMQQDAPPWQYQADEAELAMLQQADLIIWVGAELETSLARQLADIKPNGRVLELLSSNALKILHSGEDTQARDPWFWLDTRNMLILLDEMTGLLMEMDPQRAHIYRRNRLAILPLLSRLDSEMEYAYRDVSGTPVLLYHNTQAYFAQAYALKVAAHAGNTGTEPASAANLLSLRGLIDRHRPACFFVEADMPATHLDLIQVSDNTRIVELSSLGQGFEPGPDIYEQVIRHNYAAFRECANAKALDRRQADNRATLPSHRIQTRYLLTDHNGVSVTNLDFPDQYQLIYFGYTYCPDICPTSLTVLTGAMNLLGDKADLIQPLFVTVDPTRDTAEKLRQYTGYFHPRMLGLSGSEEMVARVAAGFRVQYEKVESDTDPERYSMDHTSSLFLLDPNGNFRAKFAHGMPPDELARRIDQIITGL